MKTTLTALVLAVALVSCEKEPSDMQDVTIEVTSITTTTATITGQYNGSGIVLEQGFEYRASDWPLGKTAPVDATFSRSLIMLQPSTTYFIRAFVLMECLRVYSEEVEFNTLER